MGYEPRGLPPELLKVWKKHDAEKERCWDEWQIAGSMRHEALYRKHEAVCEALESIGAKADDAKELRKLKERVQALPGDGDWYEMRDAVLALKSDLASGNL